MGSLPLLSQTERTAHFRGRVSNPPYTNLNAAMDEDDHALEHVAGLGESRRVHGVSLGVDILQGDLAGGLRVTCDEALGLCHREAVILVLAVAQHVAAALEPDRGRSFDLLATLECEHGVTFRHVSLAAPIGVLARDDGLRPFRRIGAGGRALGVPIPAQRIDDRPRHYDAANGCIVPARTERQRDRRIVWIARPHGDEHSEMPAARLTREADEVRSGLECARTELRPAQRIVDVLHGGWIGSSFPERKSSAIDTMPCVAMAS